jgi:hypothetical protein
MDALSKKELAMGCLDVLYVEKIISDEEYEIIKAGLEDTPCSTK